MTCRQLLTSSRRGLPAAEKAVSPARRVSRARSAAAATSSPASVWSRRRIRCSCVRENSRACAAGRRGMATAELAGPEELARHSARHVGLRQRLPCRADGRGDLARSPEPSGHARKVVDRSTRRTLPTPSSSDPRSSATRSVRTAGASRAQRGRKRQSSPTPTTPIRGGFRAATCRFSRAVGATVAGSHTGRGHADPRRRPLPVSLLGPYAARLSISSTRLAEKSNQTCIKFYLPFI